MAIQVAGIYKITNPKNKNYIGQSINIDRRLYEYSHRDPKNQYLLSRSIKKYGYTNHTIEILWKKSIEDDTDLTELRSILNILEIGYIKYYDATNTKCGLNLDYGGGVFNLSPLGKLRHSESLRGDKNPMYGKNLSKETRDKMSKSRSGDRHWSHNLNGRPNPNKGRKASESTKKAISDSLKKNGYWLGKSGNLNPQSIKVVQLNMDGTFIKQWESIRLAATILQINDGTIVSCCKTFKDGFCINSYKNYLWVYLKDYTKYNKVTYTNNRKISKPILQLDLNYKIVKEWENAFRIQKEFGYNSGIIGTVCKRKNKKYKDSLWIYKEEYYDNNETFAI